MMMTILFWTHCTIFMVEFFQVLEKPKVCKRENPGFYPITQEPSFL